MARIEARCGLAVLAALAACSVAADEADVAALVARLPANSGDEAMKVAAALVGTGPAGVGKLVADLRDPGGGADAKVRYALHGMAVYVSRPGGQADRKAFAAAVAAELDGKCPDGVKGFLIRQLQVAGEPAAAGAIARHLLNEALAEYAAQALAAMGGAEQAGLLRQALPGAKGKARLAIIQNLGVLRDARAADALIAALADEQRDVRLAAVYALANIGAAAAVDAVLAAAQAKDPYERIEATDSALRLARRLAEAGHPQAAARVYKTLWRTRTDPADRHVRVAALQGLAAAGGEVLADLMEAVAEADPQLRAVAVRIAASVAGEKTTMAWVERMPGAEPKVRAGILAILAQRGDPAALPAVMAALKDKDLSVRVAATRALSAFPGRKMAETLLSLLAAETPEQRGAARDGLGHMPGNEAGAVVAEAFARSSDPLVRRGLLAVLAQRRAVEQMGAIFAAAEDQDPLLRAAALRALGSLAGRAELPRLIAILTAARAATDRDAVADALATAAERMPREVVAAVMPQLDRAPPEVIAALLRPLGKAGGVRAAQTIASYVDHADPAVRDAAVRAVAQWRTKDGAPEAWAALLTIARTSDDPKHHVLALRQYITLAGSELVADNVLRRLAMYAQAMKTARRKEEKLLALAGIGGMGIFPAMKIAESYLDDKDLREAAAAAVVRVVSKLPNKDLPEVHAVLEKALAASLNERTRAEARKYLGRSADPLGGIE